MLNDTNLAAVLMRKSKPLQIVQYRSRCVLPVCELERQRSTKIFELFVEHEADGGHERQRQAGYDSADGGQ